MAEKQTNRVIVVLGAGRTGTSLLMQALYKFGMTVSEVMTPPSEQNQMGGYEDSEVFTIHSEILEILKTNQLFPLPDHWLAHPDINTKQNQLERNIESKIVNCPTIWGVKDPRTALLLPLWIQIFNSLKIVPVYLLAIRAPDTTVCSLKKQYNQGEPISELFWLHKNCAALTHTGSNCYIVHYEDWFTRPNELAQELLRYTGLDQYFTGNVNETLKELINPSLNRSIYEECQVQNEYVLKLYEVLKDCRGNEFDRNGLMAVVKECRRAVNGFKGWYLEAQKHIGLQASLRQKKNELETRLKKERQRTSSLVGEIEKARKKTDDLFREMEAERQMATDVQILKNSLSYKIGNAMVLAIKKPGWRTVRLPYDLSKVLVNAFKGPSKKAIKDDINKNRKAGRKKNHVSKSEQVGIVGNNSLSALEKAWQKRISLTHEYNQIEDDLSRLEERLKNGNNMSIPESSTNQMTEAVLHANRVLIELKDIEDEILELKIRCQSQK